jgi:hypothetical protein
MVMKNLKLSSVLLLSSIAISSIVITSCSKERIQQKSSKEYDAQATNNYLDSKKQDEQEFTVDSTGSGPIVGNQGTTISGAKNCLMKPNGDTVAFPFIVKLVELYTPKDMIYYQMPTVASDTILETDGEIRLRAYKDGVELAIKPGCDYLITMPNAAPKNYMRVFYGFTKSQHIDWTDSPASLGITTSVSPVFSTNSSYYMAQIAKLGWINCGYKRGSTTNHKIAFNSSTDDLSSVAFFIYFPDTKTVMQVRNMVSGSIPDGSSVKIIAIAVDSGGQLFSFSKSLTVNANEQIDVTMVATTDPALTASLDAL